MIATYHGDGVFDPAGLCPGNSVDKVVDGQVMGVTGQATNRAGTPEIDYSAYIYDISAMFTSDGATEITCGEPQV